MAETYLSSNRGILLDKALYQFRWLSRWSLCLKYSFPLQKADEYVLLRKMLKISMLVFLLKLSLMNKLIISSGFANKKKVLSLLRKNCCDTLDSNHLRDRKANGIWHINRKIISILQMIPSYIIPYLLMCGSCREVII